MKDKIIFDQEAIWTYLYGRVFSIAARIKGIKYCKLSGRDCFCQIIGDGVRYHFGIDFIEHPPATVYLDCNYLTEASS